MTRETALEPGDLIAGKYRIVRTVGAGAMGKVFAADHLHLGRTVAIKVMTSDASEVALARFGREAQAVAKIESEHVCKVFDVGTLDDGRPFMVMELLEGDDLSELAKKGHRFAVDEAVHYVLQACEALAEAHTRGIVHRDLKPSNLFLAKRSDGSARIKLLDFGISKSHEGGESHGLTQTDTIVGSPRFMSPEQLQSSRDADHRSDIWSLGVVLHELLTGEAAFEGGTLAELFVQILQEDPKPIRERRPDVPAAFDRVLATCFEKDRDDRYQTVADLALAVAPFGKLEGKAHVERIVRLYEASGWTRPAAPPPKATVVMPEGARAAPRAPQPTAPANHQLQAAPAAPPALAASSAPFSGSPAPAALGAPHGESTAAVSRQPDATASSSPLKLVFAALVVAGAIAGAAFFAARQGGEEAPPTPTPASPSPVAVEAPSEAKPEADARPTDAPSPAATSKPEAEAALPRATAAPPPASPPPAVPRTRPPTAPAPKPAKPASKPAHCAGDGAFFRDAQGNLKVRSECL